MSATGPVRARVLLLTTLLVMAAAGPARAAVFTGSSANYAVGNNPVWDSVGDFNNDGKADLAVTAQNIGGTGSITVLRGVGDGTFTTGATLGVDNRPQQGVVGDFNNDGKLDLVTPRLFNGDAVSLGDGNFGFSALSTVPITGNPVSVAVGDFNGDGNQDLATSSQGTNTLSVSIGNGTGSFTTSPTTYPLGGGTVNTTVVGDFNADGKQDLAIANANGHYVDVLLGNGDGTFTAAANRTIGTNGYAPFSVSTGDFNSDGKLDLATANNGDNQFGSTLGNGDGTFGSPFTRSGPSALVNVAVADFNGDRRQDLAAAGSTSNLQVVLGDNNGKFGNTDTSLTVGNNLNGIATGDFNGDGRSDLAVDSYNENKVYVLLNQSTAAVPAAGSVLISELRFAGKTGARDQYVDLYNPGTSAAHIGGWKLVGSTGGRTVFPDGALIPAKGHYLASGPVATSLSSYYSLLSPTPEDGFLAPGLTEPAGGGIKLVNLAGTTIDAAGFSSAGAGFYETTPIATPTNTTTGQLALVRRFSAGEPVDTGDNAADFKLVATDADSQSHNGNEVLGAPAPFDLRSPANINNGAQSSLYDEGASASSAPNLVYTPPASGTVSAANPGTLTLRRKITNCLGQPASGVCASASGTSATITRLKLQLTGISTYGDAFGAVPGSGGTTALLRAWSSDASSGFQQMSLDAPSPSSGGGLNSTLTIPLPAGGLASGASINVELKLRADRTGAYRLAYNLLDDLEYPSEPEATEPDPGPGTTPAPDEPTGSTPAATETDTGTVTPTGATVTVHTPATAHPAAKKHHKRKHHKRRHHKHKRKHHRRHK